ncbi:proline iminopeptidase [Deinococcus yavapaiensis KR-236]|uniref:Proline iminopeptidase n=1 Tax=Deinococcus yavapaiensis KR-236 TaxID=694435 RepID=A0A318S5B5_9DEIO|nr:proline iminopeptidase [Deinococcus yavapaiensis KR-236]
MEGEFVRVADACLHVLREGRGAPLALLPGGFGCEDYLRDVSDLLSDTFEVLRIEPRGCGRSSETLPYDVASNVRDLDGIRAALGFDTWIVGGHSAGADLALAYAVHFAKRTRALLHMAGTGVHNDRDWSAAYHAGKDAGLDPLPDPPPAWNPEVHAAMTSSWRQWIKRPELLGELARLDVPTLFLHGEQDVRPSWPVRQLAHLLPQARYEDVAGARHWLWLDHADEVRTRLRRFLGALPT